MAQTVERKGLDTPAWRMIIPLILVGASAAAWMGNRRGEDSLRTRTAQRLRPAAHKRSQ